MDCLFRRTWLSAEQNFVTDECAVWKSHIVGFYLIVWIPERTGTFRLNIRSFGEVARYRSSRVYHGEESAPFSLKAYHLTGYTVFIYNMQLAFNETRKIRMFRNVSSYRILWSLWSYKIIITAGWQALHTPSNLRSQNRVKLLGGE